MVRYAKRTAVVLAVLAAWAAVGPPAWADDQYQGNSYVEQRGGTYATTGDDARRVSVKGGAAGVYVANGLALEAEGLGYSTDPGAVVTPDGASLGPAGETDAMGTSLRAKWNVVQTRKGTVHLGAGTGILSDNDAVLGKSGLNQTNSADMGMSLNMSDSVSLKAQGRYQHIGGLGNRDAAGAVGGNVGIRISF